METPLWLLVVVPAIHLLVLVGGIFSLVWRAGRLTQTLENLGVMYEKLANDLSSVEATQTRHEGEISRIRGHLGLNGQVATP